MVPDKFNMVDMGGIDLIMMQGEEVPGLYDRLVESIAQCSYQCLYNWLFDGVIIPPSYVKMEVNEDDEVVINEGVTVSSDDVIHIYSTEPPAPDPEIIPLLAEENGVYNVPTGKDGFNPVTVDVPSYTPVIQSLSITENGTYTAPSAIDGYNPVIVNVSSGQAPDLLMDHEQISTTSQYVLPQFDSSVVITNYDFLIVKLWRNTDFWACGYLNPHYMASADYSIQKYGTNPVYTVEFNNSGVARVQYGGAYVNTYIDVYGYHLS